MAGTRNDLPRIDGIDSVKGPFCTIKSPICWVGFARDFMKLICSGSQIEYIVSQTNSWVGRALERLSRKLSGDLFYLHSYRGTSGMLLSIYLRDVHRWESGDHFRSWINIFIQGLKSWPLRSRFGRPGADCFPSIRWCNGPMNVLMRVVALRAVISGWNDWQTGFIYRMSFWAKCPMRSFNG